MQPLRELDASLERYRQRWDARFGRPDELLVELHTQERPDVDTDPR